MRKIFSSLAITVIGVNSVIATTAFIKTNQKGLAQSTKTNFGVPPRKFCKVKIQPYGAGVFNSRFAFANNLKQGFYVDFYLSPGMYNFFDEAISYQYNVGNPDFNTFHTAFLNPEAATPLEWKNTLSNYEVLIAQQDAKYHHKFEDDIENYLSFFKKDSKRMSSDCLLKFWSLFDIRKKYQSQTLDPKPRTKNDLRKQGAIFQIALTNYGTATKPNWKLDDHNTRIMLWDKENDIISHYYYENDIGVLENYEPIMYVDVVSPKQTSILREIRPFYKALEKQFGFDGYPVLHRVIQIDTRDIDEPLFSGLVTKDIIVYFSEYDATLGDYKIIRDFKISATLHVIRK